MKKANLAEEHGVEKKTIQREMQWFVKNRLVSNNVQFGYAPEPRLFKLMGRLEKLDPEKYNFGNALMEASEDSEDNCPS